MTPVQKPSNSSLEAKMCALDRQGFSPLALKDKAANIPFAHTPRLPLKLTLSKIAIRNANS